MDALTPRQEEVYLYIANYIRENGYAPSLRETMSGLGLASTNAVRQHLERLNKKGFIERNENVSRGIKIVRSRIGRSIPLIDNLEIVIAGLPDQNRGESFGQIAIGDGFPDTVFAYRVKDNTFSKQGILENDHLIIDSAGVCEIGQLALIKVPGEEVSIRHITSSDYDKNKVKENSGIFVGKLIELIRRV